MPEFRGALSASPAPQHEYWKLERMSLDEAVRVLEATHPVLKERKLSWKRAMYLLERMQCGLIIYENHSLDELESFCSSRGLPSKKHSSEPMTKTAETTAIRVLKNTLERADKTTTFKRFMDLAPELREFVYAYHFSAFSTAASTQRTATPDSDDRSVWPSPPPLTLTSKIVRRESLPLFYETAYFENDSIARFFKICPPGIFSNIRQFTLRPYSGHVNYQYHFSISGEVRAELLGIESWSGTNSGACQRRLDATAQRVSEKLRGRDNKLLLRPEDLEFLEHM